MHGENTQHAEMVRNGRGAIGANNIRSSLRVGSLHRNGP